MKRAGALIIVMMTAIPGCIFDAASGDPAGSSYPKDDRLYGVWVKADTSTAYESYTFNQDTYIKELRIGSLPATIRSGPWSVEKGVLYLTIQSVGEEIHDYQLKGSDTLLLDREKVLFLRTH